MARIVKNDKGFKVIALSHEEGEKVGWGLWTRSEDNTKDECHFLCMHCSHDIEGELYYIAVLNDVMDKECYERWYAGAKHYPDDVVIENRNFNHYRQQLGL